MGSVGAVAIAAVACVLTHALWGLPIGGLETAAYLLVVVSVVVIALQPDRNVVGQRLLRLVRLGGASPSSSTRPTSRSSPRTRSSRR